MASVVFISKIPQQLHFLGPISSGVYRCRMEQPQGKLQRTHFLAIARNVNACAPEETPTDQFALNFPAARGSACQRGSLWKDTHTTIPQSLLYSAVRPKGICIPLLGKPLYRIKNLPPQSDVAPSEFSSKVSLSPARAIATSMRLRRKPVYTRRSLPPQRSVAHGRFCTH